MRFRDLSYDERLALYERYKSGEDLAESAKEFGIRLSSLENNLRFWHRTRVLPSPKPKLDNPPAIGDCLILADPHIPYHDANFINHCIDIARDAGVGSCVIPGDLLDVNAFSPFDPNVKDTLEAELESAEQFLAALCNAFETILCLMGNHEARISKRIGYHQVDPQRLGRLISSEEKITWSPYYHCVCGSWRICHPKNASIVPGSVAARLAAKYHCNVVAGHGHIFGVAQDVSGQYVGIDSGACCDPARLEYIEVRMNTRPKVVEGAVILRNDLPILINKHFVRL